MAGISIPTDSNVEQVVATLNRENFCVLLFSRRNLLPILFEEIWDPENQTWLVESAEDEPSEQKAIEFF